MHVLSRLLDDQLEAAICCQETNSMVVTVRYEDVALAVSTAKQWQFERDRVVAALLSMDLQ